MITVPRVAALMLCTAVLNAAAAEEFVAGAELQVAAHRLQQAMPRLAVDRMAEAKRTKRGWEFRARTREEKLWVEELRVEVSAKGKYETAVTVALFRMEGGFLVASEVPAPSSQWVAKVKAAIEAAP